MIIHLSEATGIFLSFGSLLLGLTVHSFLQFFSNHSSVLFMRLHSSSFLSTYSSFSFFRLSLFLSFLKCIFNSFSLLFHLFLLIILCSSFLLSTSFYASSHKVTYHRFFYRLPSLLPPFNFKWIEIHFLKLLTLVVEKVPNRQTFQTG